MEQTPPLPHQPAAPEAPKMPPQKDRGFFEKWRQKRRASKGEAAPKPEASQTPEAPKPERRRFGRNIINLLKGKTPEAPAAAVPNQTPNTTTTTPEAPQPVSAENSPQYERATRMRRLARIILARVLGDVDSEPTVAAKRHEQPVSTEPLADAAANLQGAASNLDNTIARAQTASRPTTEAGMGGFDGTVPGMEHIGEVMHGAAERIDMRLRQLESTAEVSAKVTIAAVGLGVLAVLLTGTEYFSRKRNEQAIRTEIAGVKKNASRQEWAMQQQQVALNRLRDNHPADMGRNERQAYYQRLSAFTNEQAERTQQVSSDLEQVVEQAAPAVRPEVTVRPERHSRRSEKAAVTPAIEREPVPLMHVESAERTERSPGQQTGSAGTGFFGGGGGSIASGTGPSDLPAPQRTLDPNSREARELEVLRRAQQKRMQSNAWLYGAALGVTVVGAVAAMLLLG